jgi:hypothetical protein
MRFQADSTLSWAVSLSVVYGKLKIRKSGRVALHDNCVPVMTKFEEKNSWQCLFLLFFCSLNNRRVCIRPLLSLPIPMAWNDRWHINLGWKEHCWFFFQRKTNIRAEKWPDAVNLSVPLISSHDLWDARDVFAAFSLGFRNKTFGIFPGGFNKKSTIAMHLEISVFFSSSISRANVYARILLHTYLWWDIIVSNIDENSETRIESLVGSREGGQTPGWSL